MRWGAGIDGASILSARETAEPRADPAVAAGELADQRDAVAGEVPLRRRTHPHSASEAGQTSSPTAARPIPRPCSTRTRPARRFERAMDQIRGRYNWAAACLPPTMRRTL